MLKQIDLMKRNHASETDKRKKWEMSENFRVILHSVVNVWVET